MLQEYGHITTICPVCNNSQLFCVVACKERQWWCWWTSNNFYGNKQQYIAILECTFFNNIRLHYSETDGQSLDYYSKHFLYYNTTLLLINRSLNNILLLHYILLCDASLLCCIPQVYICNRMMLRCITSRSQTDLLLLLSLLN